MSEFPKQWSTAGNGSLLEGLDGRKLIWVETEHKVFYLYEDGEVREWLLNNGAGADKVQLHQGAKLGYYKEVPKDQWVLTGLMSHFVEDIPKTLFVDGCNCSSFHLLNFGHEESCPERKS